MPRVRLLVIRYGEMVGPPEGTIRAHQDIIARAGYVWFGKLGKAIGHTTAIELLDQIRAGVPTRVLLVTKASGTYDFHLCGLLDIAYDLPTEERGAVPAYYESEGSGHRGRGWRWPLRPSTWFKLSCIEPIDSQIARDVIVVSSGSTLLQALNTSMVPWMRGETDASRLQLSCGDVSGHVPSGGCKL